MGVQNENGQQTDRERAERLWKMLDDIDTQSDATRGDKELFYERAMKIVAQRHEVFSSDGQSLLPTA